MEDKASDGLSTLLNNDIEYGLPFILLIDKTWNVIHIPHNSKNLNILHSYL